MNVTKNGSIDVQNVICPQEVILIGIAQTAEVICLGMSHRNGARIRNELFTTS